MITAIDFVVSYNETLDAIGLTLRDEYAQTLVTMRETDPHDFVAPDQSFLNSNHMYGFLYRLIISEHKKAQHANFQQ